MVVVRRVLVLLGARLAVRFLVAFFFVLGVGFESVPGAEGFAVSGGEGLIFVLVLRGLADSLLESIC